MFARFSDFARRRLLGHREPIEPTSEPTPERLEPYYIPDVTELNNTEIYTPITSIDEMGELNENERFFIFNPNNGRISCNYFIAKDGNNIVYYSYFGYFGGKILKLTSTFDLNKMYYKLAEMDYIPKGGKKKRKTRSKKRSTKRKKSRRSRR
jgi:hypothetical protein